MEETQIIMKYIYYYGLLIPKNLKYVLEKNIMIDF